MISRDLIEQILYRKEFLLASINVNKQIVFIHLNVLTVYK